MTTARELVAAINCVTSDQMVGKTWRSIRSGKLERKQGRIVEREDVLVAYPSFDAKDLALVRLFSVAQNGRAYRDGVGTDSKSAAECADLAFYVRVGIVGLPDVSLKPRTVLPEVVPQPREAGPSRIGRARRSSELACQRTHRLEMLCEGVIDPSAAFVLAHVRGRLVLMLVLGWQGKRVTVSQSR